MTLAASRFSNELRYRPGEHPAQVHLTPPYVLDPVREAFGGVIGLDPCTTPDNPVSALRFYCPPADGRELPWDAPSVFCNPPYGKARVPWVRRCVGAAMAGSAVVLLIPAHTDTRVFQQAIAEAGQVVFVAGRLKFGTPRENGRQYAASHPSALIGWNVDLAPCAHLGVRVVLARPDDGLRLFLHVREVVERPGGLSQVRARGRVHMLVHVGQRPFPVPQPRGAGGAAHMRFRAQGLATASGDDQPEGNITLQRLLRPHWEPGQDNHRLDVSHQPDPVTLSAQLAVPVLSPGAGGCAQERAFLRGQGAFHGAAHAHCHLAGLVAAGHDPGEQQAGGTGPGAERPGEPGRAPTLNAGGQLAGGVVQLIGGQQRRGRDEGFGDGHSGVSLREGGEVRCSALGCPAWPGRSSNSRSAPRGSRCPTRTGTGRRSG